MGMKPLPWPSMEWLHPPARAERDGEDLVVETKPGGDFWRVTSYGFVHDDGHFLGAPLPSAAAIEVTFDVDFAAQFDQAGLMLRVDAETWIKAGVELSDGQLLASAVVTRGRSDWSVAPLPARVAGSSFTIRASRTGDAVTIRYRVGGGQLRLLRLAYLPEEADVRAGIMTCSPSRGGLVVRFRPVLIGPPDAQLHEG